MIHEATGKFWSRCVSTDLRSLALLIELLLRHWSCAGGAERPHIGAYAGKTNAFAGCKRCNPPSIEEPSGGLPAAVLRENGAYWPWFFSTWLQAAEICARFCCKQARLVNSPCLMAARQWRWTSRLQAACSSGVPLRAGCAACWAKAEVV